MFSNTSINDYGQGNFTPDLMKAMMAGNTTGRDLTNQLSGFEALKFESLEGALKILEYTMDDIKLFGKMPKQTAYNTVEEYNQLVSYGNRRVGGFVREGEGAKNVDSKYIRRAAHIKYLSIGGEVTAQAQMVKGMVDAYPQEVENKMLWIARLANEALVKGNSSIVPEEYDSLYKLHSAYGFAGENVHANKSAYYKNDVVIDLRGKSLTQKYIQDAAVIISNNYGRATDLWAPTTVMSAYAQQYFDVQRIMQTGSAVKGDMGIVPTTVSTTAGQINLNADLFMRHEPSRYLIDGETDQDAPNKPVADVTAPIALAADSVSRYLSTDGGKAFYAVAAINRYGISELTLLGSVTIAQGQAVDLKFTSGGGAEPATGYIIYRTEVTTASSATNEEFFEVFRVPATELTTGYDGGAAGVVRDRGYSLPGTEECFMTGMNDTVQSFKQLAPMSKLDLAITKLSRSFIVFFWGVPVLYAPLKMVRFVNVSKTFKV